MEAKIVERRIRPTGTPPRCAVCGAHCEPSYHGPVLCSHHQPMKQGTALNARGLGAPPSRQAVWKAKQQAAMAPTAKHERHVATVKERLKAKNAGTWPDRPVVRAMPVAGDERPGLSSRA